MKAVILAGGYGTRLQPMTLRTPKCILPLGDKNSIMHIITNLSKIGIKEIIVSLNETQFKVKDYLDSLKLSVTINYCFEKSTSDENKLGAIGALLYVVKRFGPDDYLIVGADNYTQGIDYKEFVAFHRAKKADVTIALYELSDVSRVQRFGIGVLNNDSRITRFQEKPKVKEALSNLASTFIYLINKDFFTRLLPDYVNKELSAGRRPDNIGDLWAYYCRMIKIYGFKFSGYWGDVGQPDYYVETNRKALDLIQVHIHKSVALPKSSKVSGNVIIEEGAKINKNVVIIGPCLIGRGVSVDEGSMIGPYTTILNNTVIGKNNIVAGSIVFSRVTTGDNVKINHAIVDGNAVIHNDCRIHENAMIGYNCIINSDSQILTGSKIWPFIQLDTGSVINSKIFYPIESTPYKDIVMNSNYWK